MSKLIDSEASDVRLQDRYFWPSINQFLHKLVVSFRQNYRKLNLKLLKTLKFAKLTETLNRRFEIGGNQFIFIEDDWSQLKLEAYIKLVTVSLLLIQFFLIGGAFRFSCFSSNVLIHVNAIRFFIMRWLLIIATRLWASSWDATLVGWERTC